MPNFDGTGPQGTGPTGGKQGTCASAETRGNNNRGQGNGRGRGMQRNNLSLEEEEKNLTQRLDALRKAKEDSKE